MEYVCVDVETTGLDSANDEVVEVCAIAFDDIGKITRRLHHLCEPIKGFVPAEAAAIHGLTMTVLAGKPHYADVREELAAFIGGATVIGHNVIEFDLKFLKIIPKSVEDTLAMCRKIWPGKNNLANACKRVGIKFDKGSGHRAGYDVEKTIELYLTLKAMDKTQPQQSLFDQKPQLQPTQAYSYSRISLFQQCPWKWYQVYVLKQKERSQALDVGSCIHLIAQMSATWCYAKSFANRFSVYAKANDLKFNDAVGNAMRQAVADKLFYMPKNHDDVTTTDIGMFLYMNMGYCQSFFGITMTEMINKISEAVAVTEFEKMERPPLQIYNEIVQRAIAKTRMVDVEALTDLRFLSEYFYGQKDFLVIDGTIAMVEKRLCYGRNWEPLKDFFDANAFFRGVIDIIEYNGPEMITITDYKSGRKMLTPEQLRQDRQLLVYVMLVHMLMPGISTIRIRHHYIRFGKVVEVAISNVSEVAAEARAWVDASIAEIEECLQKGDSEFKPSRNQFCGSCQFMDNNKCPMFNIKNINDIKDPANFEIKTVDDVVTAYKKIETNKSENSALTAKCKAFVIQHHQNVVVDGNAVLDFWTKENREYDAVEVAKLLVEKQMKLSEILPYFSLTATNWEKLWKLLRKKEVEVTAAEVVSVSSVKRKSDFKALTREEAEADDYVNVTVDQPAKDEPTSSTKA